MARYCPNCSAELKLPEVDCWNCGALFGSNSSWTPTDQPTGPFKEQKNAPTPGPTDVSTAGANGGAAWKIPLLMVAFLATLLPYAASFLGLGPLDVLSFIVVWVLFFVLRANLPQRMSAFTPVICGVILACPPSLLFMLFDPRVTYYHSGGGVTYALAYFILVMSAAHYLAGCIKWVRP